MTTGQHPFRDALYNIVPPWLQGFWGSRLLFAIGVQFDNLSDALVAAIKMRFPNVYSEESLPLIGRERGIIRGFDESAEAYAVRLRAWWDTHRRRGNPYTLLRVLQGYLTPHAVKLRIVNNGGAWYTLNADGTQEYYLNANWNWDGNTEKWSRFWIVIYPPADLWVRDGTWGDGESWGSNATSWGSTATVQQVETIRALVAEWQAPHSRCNRIIVSFDADAFKPTDNSSIATDGLWGRHGKNVAGVMVAARDPRAIYWDGTP